MEKRRITHSSNMRKDLLDDNYSLFDDGEVIHEYDKSQYPGQYDLAETISIEQLDAKIKDDFVRNASKEDIELVKRLLDRK